MVRVGRSGEAKRNSRVEEIPGWNGVKMRSEPEREKELEEKLEEEKLGGGGDVGVVGDEAGGEELTSTT